MQKKPAQHDHENDERERDSVVKYGMGGWPPSGPQGSQPSSRCRAQQRRRRAEHDDEAKWREAEHCPDYT